MFSTPLVFGEPTVQAASFEVKSIEAASRRIGRPVGPPERKGLAFAHILLSLLWVASIFYKD